MSKSSWHTQFKRAGKGARTDTQGTVHHSKAEARRADELLLLEKAGEIRTLRQQVSFELRLPNGNCVFTPTGRCARYIADFTYERKTGRGWEYVVEDSKGAFSRESQFRIAVFEAIYGMKVYISGKRKRL